jgi:hypothetical protein
MCGARPWLEETYHVRMARWFCGLYAYCSTDAQSAEDGTETPRWLKRIAERQFQKVDSKTSELMSVDRNAKISRAERMFHECASCQ